jgi:hypothetical protein
MVRDPQRGHLPPSEFAVTRLRCEEAIVDYSTTMHYTHAMAFLESLAEKVPVKYTTDRPFTEAEFAAIVSAREQGYSWRAINDALPDHLRYRAAFGLAARIKRFTEAKETK